MLYSQSTLRKGNAMENPELPKKYFYTLRIVVLFALLVISFSAYIRYFNNQRAGSQQVYDNLAVQDARLQNIENGLLIHEKRIKDLEDAQKLAATSPRPSAIASAATATTPTLPDERIDALEKQIAALKTAAPAQDSARIFQSIRMLSAFHHLSDKVIGGKPFATELSAFEDIAKPDESAGSPLATLAPYADSGIPTFATLLVTFDQSVETLNAAEAVPPPNASLWERFTYNLAHLITIRRINQAQTGNSIDAILSRAQSHLEKEEFEAAMAEIKSLPDNSRGNFAAWLDDAQMVTEAPSLIDQVEEQVLQKTFAGSAVTTPAAPSLQIPQPTPVAPPAEDTTPAAPGT